MSVVIYEYIVMYENIVICIGRPIYNIGRIYSIGYAVYRIGYGVEHPICSIGRHKGVLDLAMMIASLMIACMMIASIAIMNACIAMMNGMSFDD